MQAVDLLASSLKSMARLQSRAPAEAPIISWRVSHQGSETSLSITAAGANLDLAPLMSRFPSGITALDIEAGSIQGAAFISTLSELRSLRLVAVGAEDRLAAGLLEPKLVAVKGLTTLEQLELPCQEVDLLDGCAVLASLAKLRKVCVGRVVEA
jgi:hypothetical protein